MFCEPPVRPAAVMSIILSVTACSRTIPSIAPVGLEPLDRAVVEAWMADFDFDSNRAISIRPWRFVNDRGSAAGRAMVRIAPPDSMRFDYRGPFGKSGGAVIHGSEAVWSRPEGDFSALVAVAPVFWAAVGLPQPPPAGVPLVGLSTPAQRVWQYSMNRDTFTFIAEGNPVTRLQGEVRRDGRTLAVSVVTFDPASGFPSEAQIDFPHEPSRFTFEVDSVATAADFGPEVWDEP